MNKKLQIKIQRQKNRLFGSIIFLSLFILYGNMGYAKVILSQDLNIEKLIQQKKISLNYTNQTAKFILSEIEKLTGIGYVIKSNVDPKLLANLSINVHDVTIEQALNTLFAATDCTYIIDNKIITVIKKQQIAQSTNRVNFSGKVIVKGKNTPVAGATLIVKGTSKGAITDEKGEFTISNLNEGSEIEVAFLGMKSVLIKATSQTKPLIIELEEDVLAVSDVVVTGYFNRDKTGFAGAVTTITDKEIARYASSNVLEIIGNLDASFKVDKDIETGSDPNKMPDFTIRGKGTYNNKSTAPVFILDGFEVSSQYIFDMDMNRIKTISILKDASASILYGSRAANGVVVIETKTPEPGKLRVTYNFRPTVAFADLTDYNLMNAAEKLEFEKYAGEFTTVIPEGYYKNHWLATQTELDQTYNTRLREVQRGVDTYWISKPLRGAFTHNHSLNVEGGDEVIRYSVDANYDNIKGVMKGSDRSRFGMGFRLIYRIKDKITINNQVFYNYLDSNNSPFGSFSTYTKLNPYEVATDENGKYLTTLSNGKINPLYDAYLPYKSNQKDQNISEQLSIDWFAATDLRVKGNFKITKGTSNNRTYKSPKLSEYEEVLEIEKRGYMLNGNGNTLDYSGNLTIQYNKILDKHVLFLGVGTELNVNQNDNISFELEGFPTDMFVDPGFALQYRESTKPSSSEGTAKGVGFFANLNYIYDNRFFGDVSVRYDGNSRFGLENKFAPFWSVGAGWNIDNESFWKGIKSVVNQFKIRGSYGVTGSQNFNEYDAKTMYEYKQTPYKGTIPAQLLGYGNPNLKWQKQGMLNIGIDLAFLKNRLTLTANYYNRDTDGSLTAITVAPSLGFNGNKYTENIGTIINKGFDIAIVGQIILKDNFAWNVTLQTSHNKSQLKNISNSLKGVNEEADTHIYTPALQYFDGQSMSVLKAVESLGIDPANGKELFKKIDGGVTYIWSPSDKVVLGDTEPTMFGNISTNFFYKSWELSISAQYRFGGQTYNSTLAEKVEGANPKENADRRALAERWKEVGNITFYKNIADFSQSYLTSRFIQDENYINFSNLSLGYNVNRKVLTKIGLNRLKISFGMTDLLQLSSIKRERGLGYPFERRFVFGLLVGF